MAHPVVDILQSESGRIVEWGLRRNIFPGNPILNLIPRATFPQGMGQDLSVITYERSAPVDANPAWHRVAVVDGQEGGSCLPPVYKIPVGSTKRTFYLYRVAVEGPDFCATDLWFAGMLGSQLEAITGILTQYIRILWELHDQDEYFQLVKYKVIVDGCPPSECSTEGITTWTAAATCANATCPTSTLTQGVLDRYRLLLTRDGAAASAMGFDEGEAILTLMTSTETSHMIKHELEADHFDLRYAKPSLLIAPYGVGVNYKGFYHLKIPFPRRFSCNAGTITQIPAWTMGNASKGEKAELNSSWLTASYEESVIFDRAVMTQLIPQPIVNPAPKFNFDPVNYLGEVKAMNIKDRVNNPDGTILYHRALLAAASMPGKPELGVAFLHLRCDPACNLVTACPT